MAIKDLTRRQRQVVRCVAQGLTNKEIGEALIISESTVKSHLAVASEVLGAKNRAHLVYLAYIKGGM